MILLKDDSGFAGKEIERENVEHQSFYLRLPRSVELLGKRRLEEESGILAIWASGSSLLASCKVF